MTSFSHGDRVEIPVHFDSWMRGDRFGVVVKVATTGTLTLRLDVSGRELRIFPREIPNARKVADAECILAGGVNHVQTHCSEDIRLLFHGYMTPTVACGFHETYYRSEVTRARAEREGR